MVNMSLETSDVLRPRICPGATGPFVRLFLRVHCGAGMLREMEKYFCEEPYKLRGIVYFLWRNAAVQGVGAFLNMMSPKYAIADSLVLSVSVMMATPEMLVGSSPKAFL